MADVSFMTVNIVLSLVLFGASVILPFLQMGVDRNFTFRNISEMLLKYALFFNVGCLFIMGCAGQFLYAQEISSCIGCDWSPFQYELAFSELCVGVLGLLSPIFYREFWLATIMSAVLWLIGGSAVHLYYLFMFTHDALYHASFVIGWNIVIALWLVLLYAFQAKIGSQLKYLFSLWGRQSPAVHEES